MEEDTEGAWRKQKKELVGWGAVGSLDWKPQETQKDPESARQDARARALLMCVHIIRLDARDHHPIERRVKNSRIGDAKQFVTRISPKQYVPIGYLGIRSRVISDFFFFGGGGEGLVVFATLW